MDDQKYQNILKHASSDSDDEVFSIKKLHLNLLSVPVKIPLESFHLLDIKVEPEINGQYHPRSILYQSVNSVVVQATKKQQTMMKQQIKQIKQYDLQKDLVAIKFSQNIPYEAKILQTIHKARAIKTVIKPIKNYKQSMVLPYYEGSLSSIIQNCNYVDTQVIFTLLQNCIETLTVLRQLGIVHCDVKSSNILYDIPKSGFIKRFVLVDFQSCLYIQDLQQILTQRFLRRYNQNDGAWEPQQRTETWQYVAPECLKSIENISQYKIDLWGVGCILFQCLTGQSLLPFQIRSKESYQAQFFSYACQSKLSQRLKRFSRPSQIKLFQPILIALLKPNPNQRASIEDVARFLKNNMVSAEMMKQTVDN